MNATNIHYLNMFFGAGAIAMQIFCVIVLLILFFGPKKNKLLDFVDKHFLVLSFLMGLAAWSILIYSEIIDFVPCYLCWWQRVFMFPLAFIYGIAFWIKDRKVIRYTLPLLVAGFYSASYQSFFYYFGNTSSLPCDASGVSCYQHLVSEFGGYISIPMLSLTSFIFMLTLVAVAHFYGKNKID